MRIVALAFLAIIPASARGDVAHRPMPWSPDGKWLAYVVDAPAGDPAPRPGWIFGPAAPGPDPEGRAEPSPGQHGASRLWATRADLGSSILVDESREFLIAPAWSPDGRALAFGRRGVGGDGRGTFEVVIWEGPARRRVVASRPLPDDPDRMAWMAAEAIAWSADGRYLAVPHGEVPGLAILRAEDGRQVNAIPGARLPAWSPDGPRLAFFVRDESGDTLAWLESALGRPKPLVGVVRAMQPPSWTRDGLTTVSFGSRAADPFLVGGPIAPVNLVRVRLDSGQSDVIRSLTAEQGLQAVRPIDEAWFAIDREGDNLFSTTSARGRDHHVVWFRPRDARIQDRMPILDPTMPVSSLSPSPLGGVLAVRVGPPDRPSPPLLVDLDGRDRRLRAVAPDEASRASWLGLLVESVRSSLAGRSKVGPAPARPTLLPFPGELGPADEIAQRIRRVARLARSLDDRPSDEPRAEPALAALLDEARLFFDYLDEDYPAALASLEAFEPRVDTPDRRLALLGARAQIDLGRGEFDRADRLIAFLGSIEPRPIRRLEWTAAGPVLVSDARPGPSWVASLETRAALLRSVDRAAAPAAFPAEEGHFNPDAPQPGLGLDPIVPGGFDRPIFLQPPPRVPARPPEGVVAPKRRVIRPGPPAPLP